MRKFLMIAIVFLLSFPAVAAELALKSAQISDGTTASSTIEYNANGCNGENRSPELSWSGEPDATRSFVVSAFDPDAPNPGGWTHWLAIDIPADIHALKTNAGAADGSGLPQGASQLRNSYGQKAFGGPCPPRGDKPHRYQFTVYAMPQASTLIPAAQIGQSAMDWLKSAALASSDITVTFQRN